MDVDNQLPQAQPDEAQQPAPESQLINVVDPETGDIGSLPSHQLADAQAQGYSIASPDQVTEHLRQQKYGGAGQGLISGLEGAGEAASFGLSTELEKKLGVKPEDILGRREEHPVAHAVGQVAGLAGSSLIPGVGEANLLEKAGQAATEAVGLAAPITTIEKIGSAAVKGAVETGLFQSGDEVAKSLQGDPSSSVQSALLNVGLSSVLGAGLSGAVGAVPAAWKLGAESKTGKVLKLISDRLNGEATAVPSEVLDAVAKSGIQLPPELAARTIDDPVVQDFAKKLVQTDSTAAGLSYQNKFKQFSKDANDAAIRAFGKTPEELEASPEFSEYEAGRKLVGSDLADEVKEKVDPLVSKFNELRENYGSLELPKSDPAKAIPSAVDQMSQKVSDLIQQERWSISPSSDIMREANRVLTELPNLKTIGDIDSYISRIGENTYDPMNASLTRAGSLMKNVLKESEADIIGSQIGKTKPELLNEYKDIRAAWRAGSELKDALDSRLNVKGSLGKYSENLREFAKTDGEAAFRRLSGKNDAELLSFLQENFPKTAESLKNLHLDQLFQTAKNKAKLGEVADSNVLMKKIKGMSPELRSFIVSPETQSRLDAIETLTSHLKDPNYNFSNTARTWDSLMGNIPGAATSAVTMLLTHNPLMAGALGLLTRVMGKDAPDAAKYALLKFLGSSEKIDAQGFKASFDYIHNVIQGQNLMGKAVKNVFNAEKDVIPTHMIPTEKDRARLEKQISDLSNDGDKMLDLGGKTGHYLPDHQQAIGEMGARIINTLKNSAPSEDKQGPLGPKREPTFQEKKRYERVLDIAQQPLVVMKDLKEGKITSQDVVLLKNFYPELYSNLNQKLSEEMISATHKKDLPYALKTGLSIFMGQPLESSLSQASLQMNQMVGAQSLSPSQEQSNFHKQMNHAHSLKDLGKLPAQYLTPDQARVKARQQVG